MSIDQLITVLTSVATLVNSLILWPLFKGMKSVQQDHGARLGNLERHAVAQKLGSE